MPVMERKARRSPAAASKAIPIFGLGRLQRSPFVSTVERVNCVVEMTDNGRPQAALFGLPGLLPFLTGGDVPLRAYYIREGEDVFYVVSENQILSVTLTG